MTGKARTKSKHELELEQARHFMQWVTLCEPARITRLDQRKDRSRPEFAFYYPSGQRYTLELTSWLTPELKKLRSFLETNVSQPLGSSLPGTFALYIPFDKLKDGQVTKKQATNLVTEIKQIGSSYVGSQTYQLSVGSLARVRDDGHRLVPVITSPELPPRLDENNKVVGNLRHELIKILSEAQQKFRCYRGMRVLVLDISQNGLDIDYHAGVSKEGPGIVYRWLSTMLNHSTAIHYVCLSQGIRVWHGGDFGRMLTGHIYEGRPAPNYREVWCKLGFPPILQSFGH